MVALSIVLVLLHGNYGGLLPGPVRMSDSCYSVIRAG